MLRLISFGVANLTRISNTLDVKNMIFFLTLLFFTIAKSKKRNKYVRDIVTIVRLQKYI